MNMQTIQIFILMLDGIVKLAPWRIVTETMDRIGYGASEGLVRILSVIAVFCAGLCGFPPIPVIGSLLLIGDLGAMAPHVRISSPLFSHILLGFCLGVAVWGGLWLRGRILRALMPLES
jgi:hypothetical protein